MEIHELPATALSPRIEPRHEFDAEREVNILLERRKEMRRVRERSEQWSAAVIETFWITGV